MRWIYLSPHLDDAVFSAGGLIYEQTRAGFPVEIWTIMSGFPKHNELSPFAKSIHKKWGTGSAEETMRIRRVENDKAAAIVGAKNLYLDFVDSLYRLSANGRALYSNSFSPLHEEEALLPKQVVRELSKHLLPDDFIVCPLALGGHVDHLISFKAMRLFDIAPFYMADIPYLFDKPQGLWRKTLGMKKSIHPISKNGLKAWIKAMQEYESQIKVEFKSIELMEEQISSYWNKNKSISLWKKR